MKLLEVKARKCWGWVALLSLIFKQAGANILETGRWILMVVCGLNWGKETGNGLSVTASSFLLIIGFLRGQI